MSKLETTKRYHLIINTLRSQKQANFDEIADIIQEAGYSSGKISLRTFQRDIADIDTLFGITIKFNRAENCYFIKEDLSDEIEKRFLETFDLVNALKNRDELSNFISFDNRKQGGTEHFYGLLHAIRNRWQITFSYQKFYKSYSENRTVSPLALKEFKYRWYLFARDAYYNLIKTYALDRLSNLEIKNTHFDHDTDFDIAEYLRYCFGVIVPQDEQPQEILLSFTPFQGNYIKTLPLHHSQKTLIDNDEELRISLNLYITHDLKMEILSYGKDVKVLAPESFANEMKKSFISVQTFIKMGR
jgi:predicted DNA-binding transcriptional regulator YafY